MEGVAIKGFTVDPFDGLSGEKVDLARKAHLARMGLALHLLNLMKAMDMESPMEWAIMMRCLRISGVTDDDAGSLLSVSPTTVMRWRKGEHYPRTGVRRAFKPMILGLMEERIGLIRRMSSGSRSDMSSQARLAAVG